MSDETNEPRHANFSYMQLCGDTETMTVGVSCNMKDPYTPVTLLTLPNDPKAKGLYASIYQLAVKHLNGTGTGFEAFKKEVTKLATVKIKDLPDPVAAAKVAPKAKAAK